jgi:DNA-binding MarR family transcriptional regulator
VSPDCEPLMTPLLDDSSVVIMHGAASARLVKAMEQMGLIARRQLEGNRKNMHVFLTPAGRALQDKLVPLAEEVNRLSVRGLPDETVALMRQSLLAVIENLAAEDAA